MSDIKPVFYVDPCTLRCRTMDDISDESTIYYRRGDKVAEKDVALYSEDVIESLQKEIAELKAALAIKQEHIESNQVVGTYCLGYTHQKCDLCKHSKNWDDLNDLPDAERMTLQNNAIRINSDKCRLTGMGEFVEIHQPKAIEPAQDNEGWIDVSLTDFACGETPEDPDIRVDVKFVDGTFEYWEKCGGYRWRDIGSDKDIIAYRIVKESQ